MAEVVEEVAAAVVVEPRPANRVNCIRLRLRPQADASCNTTNIMSRSNSHHLILAAFALLALAMPASAADPSSAPLFGGYWSSFLDHWGDYFKKQNGVIMAALGLGVVSLFIITRGKWKK